MTTRTTPTATSGGDPRLAAPRWDAAGPDRMGRARFRLLGAVGMLATGLYLAWLLTPGRIGNPVLYGLLVAAELFNVVQAVGFWWTAGADRTRPRVPSAPTDTVVDVFIPIYDEPVDVVEPTIAAAVALAGARVRVAVLDDGGRDEIEAVAHRDGARYVRRTSREGAKAGNINHALGVTSAPFIAVFDCDHVPHRSFLLRTLGHLTGDRRVAVVQTPQYYANTGGGGIAEAAWAQQALFFGSIARGKDAHGSMICCGTNMVLRREALEQAGGFPEGTVTEDFMLSIRLQELGWDTAYVAEVLASGLGPEDLASYVSQQQRWARGCVGALRAIVRARLPVRKKLQYLLSAGYFLSGWTALVYMALPVVRILDGAQPLASATADQFLLHFAPYYGLALLAVAVAGRGTYTFAAFSLAFSTFWIHVASSLAALTGRRGRFVVTPKRGSAAVQVRPALPALVCAAVLAGAALVGLVRDAGSGTLNNVAFAAMHITVLLCGTRYALRPGPRRDAAQAPLPRVSTVDVAA